MDNDGHRQHSTLEAILLREATAQTVVDANLLHWVAKFGVPGHLTSDRGVQFTSQLWEIMAKALSTKLHCTTAYHPTANGLVKQQHRKMKDSLKSCLEARPNWSQELWAVLLGMRTSKRPDIGASTAELVFRTLVTFPGDLIMAKDYQPASGDLLKRIRRIAAGRSPAPTSAHNTATTSTERTANVRLRVRQGGQGLDTPSNEVHGWLKGHRAHGQEIPHPLQHRRARK